MKTQKKKKMRHKPNIGSEVMASGKFGEGMIRGYLARIRNVFVSGLDGVAFDMIVKDPQKKFFKTNKTVGISVKNRKEAGCTTVNLKNIRKEAKRWDFDPYIGIVDAKTKKILLFPLEVGKRCKRKTGISQPQLLKLAEKGKKRIRVIKWDVEEVK